MKNIEEITMIINSMTEEDFERLIEAFGDKYFELDSRISRNGGRRLNRVLKKYGLTLDEYWQWENL